MENKETKLVNVNGDTVAGVVITTFMEGVFMPVATKQSSLPVAILAITLLKATLAAQCEKLSTLKPDNVHRRQTVLHSSSRCIRPY